MLTLTPVGSGCGYEFRGGDYMAWKKPEFKEVKVTLEVSAYSASK